MEPKRYVILDHTHQFANLILWDGITMWAPPEGHTIVLAESPEGQAAIADWQATLENETSE